jgi:hypothetical protein
VGVNASKNKVGIHHGAYALKNIQKVPSTHNSLAYLSSGPIGPAVVNDDVGQMPKKLDPSLWHPHYMRLHGRWEILDLGHRNCTSERGEVLLHPASKLSQPLRLEVPLWLLVHRTVVGPASGRGRRRVLVKSVGRTGPTSVHNRYIDVSTLMHIKMIYIKEIKN